MIHSLDFVFDRVDINFSTSIANERDVTRFLFVVEYWNEYKINMYDVKKFWNSFDIFNSIEFAFNFDLLAYIAMIIRNIVKIVDLQKFKIYSKKKIAKMIQTFMSCKKRNKRNDDQNNHLTVLQHNCIKIIIAQERLNNRNITISKHVIWCISMNILFFENKYRKKIDKRVEHIVHR